MFSEISELETIREQKSRLSARERELTTPVLSDVGFISTIYEWFKDLLKSGEESQVAVRRPGKICVYHTAFILYRKSCRWSHS